jgi:hypothetical protein
MPAPNKQFPLHHPPHERRPNMTRTPDLPMFLIDCTRPLDDQLTPGQLAWVKQWAESNECRGCGWSHTWDMPCMPADYQGAHHD